MTTRRLIAIAAVAAAFATLPPQDGDAATDIAVGGALGGASVVAAAHDDASGARGDNIGAPSAAGKSAKIDNRFDFEHVSCRGGENEIRVIVTGVKRNEGLIIADMYPNDQEVFLRGRGRIKKVRYAARAPETKFCVPAPGPGVFAMAVYHDRNANGNFDKTGLGLPAEPWGLSNNPRGLFGPPKIERTLFEVDAGGAALEIELN